MTLKVVPQSPPLETNVDGVMLVGKTRVTLDTIIAAFDSGATAKSLNMPRVIEITASSSLGKAIADIFLFIECGVDREL